MSLLSSILNFAFVVGAGWFVIYYLVPKFESGELGGLIPGAAATSGGMEGSPDEEVAVAGDLADAITGDEAGTTEKAMEETPPAEEKKKCKGKKCKEPYDPSKGIKAKEESKKKKKAKAEMRIMEYLGDYYGLY